MMSPRTGINQEIIINKAVEIAEKGGMEAVTMATLARELSIKSPSLYNHFKGLKEVKLALALKALNLFYQYLKKATLNQKDGSEAIRAIGKAYIEFANQHPGLYEALISSPDPSSNTIQIAEEAIVDLIMEAISVSPLNEKEQIHAVRGLRSLLHGLVDLKRKGGFNLPLDFEESLEVNLEIFIKGLNEK